MPPVTPEPITAKSGFIAFWQTSAAGAKISSRSSGVRLVSSIERATKTLRSKSAAMIVLDIDEFKRINDDFGHPTGDAVILGVVGCLRRIVGERGFIGRVGGEEFTVLLPGHDPDSAALLAERMREAIGESLVVPPVDRSITASFGVSNNAAGTGFDTAYGLADAALYRAKRGGRNRVEFADQ
ncbi:diguanylate cyclase [Caballeronia catudaia]|uniref:diguanylate cyclase n=1 Tax=Caballeronia catudaia TaxID=1777136 RepID=A0A158DPT1_9BURK|nr:diguanylate cyclase [Caballeronia catudaia]